MQFTSMNRRVLIQSRGVQTAPKQQTIKIDSIRLRPSEHVRPQHGERFLTLVRTIHRGLKPEFLVC